MAAIMEIPRLKRSKQVQEHWVKSKDRATIDDPTVIAAGPERRGFNELK
jgi:hypothetical protein